MKVLAIVHMYPHKNLSGGELYIHNVLKEIQQRGHSVTVLIPKCEKIEKFEYEGIKIFETNEKNYLEYIKSCDLAVTHLDFSNEVGDYCTMINKKCMLIIHSYHEIYFRQTTRNNIFVVYNCYLIFEEYKKNKKINKNYCIFHPYIDFQNFLKNFDVDIEEREYITMINPSASKGGDVAYTLAKHFKNKKFLIVQGGYYKHLQNLDKFRKLSNVFVIKNTKDILNSVYKRSKIVLMPSRFETYGMVAGEAMAMGIPVIVNSYSEPLSFNVGKNGLKAPVPVDEVKNIEQIKEWKQKIEILDDKNTYILYSSYYLDRAEEHFQMREQQKEIFLNLLKNI